MNPEGKLVDLTELKNLRRLWRIEGKQVVFTNGCFDLLHVGHVSLLKRAALLGNILVVGLNNDHSVKLNKGIKRPVISAQHRARILIALRAVDYVILYAEGSPFKLIEALEPDVLVKASDWALENIVGREFVESHGGRVVRLPHEWKVSTSTIIDQIVAKWST